MPHTPKVSIILPNYNYAKYLDERIQSILNQTYRDLELIIIDDGSTDNSRSVISKYVYDSRVQTKFFDKQSSSTYQRWNDGARIAQGEYILFAGADDSCSPKLLEKLVEKLDEYPTAGLAYTQSWLIDDKGARMGLASMWIQHLSETRWNTDFFGDGKKELPYLFHNNIIPNASAVLIRREKFEKEGGFDTRLNITADWMLWSKILVSSDIAFVSEPLNLFRCHSHTVRETIHLLVALKEIILVRSFIRRKISIPKGVLEETRPGLYSAWSKFLKEHKEYIVSRENIDLYINACIDDPMVNYNIAKYLVFPVFKVWRRETFSKRTR